MNGLAYFHRLPIQVLAISFLFLVSCQPVSTQPPSSAAEEEVSPPQSKDQVVAQENEQPTLVIPEELTPVAQPPGFPLSDKQRKRLVHIVKNWHFPYNEEVGLLRIPKPRPKFKNNWASDPMHAIRWSFEHAVICMDTGEEQYRQRALRILDLALPFQDTDPNSKSYGLWSDYMEIPIPEMRRVDGNTADFIGINLLQIRLLHGDRLPDDMKKRVDEAIIHAARSVKRRDVTPAYTNPAMMSLIVTLVVGKAYNQPEIWEYGKDKLKKILDYTKDQGSVSEYNSPNYNIVALDAIRQVKNYIDDPEVLEQLDELYNMVWKHVAVRYHAPTGQWSGPHSRSYQDLLRPAQKQILKAAVKGEPARPPVGQESRGAFLHRRIHEVPEDLKPYFKSLEEPREVVEMFVRAKHPGQVDFIGTTWLTPELSLGSINRGDMWNQRRNLQAYWGDKKAAYFRTRFMKDDDDFASVNFFSEQKQNRVLAGLNFSTDGGDKHLFFDAIKNGNFKAKRLVLRFQFGGAAKDAEFTLPEKVTDPVYVKAAGMNFFLMAPVALLDGKPGVWKTGREKNFVYLDLVLYEGETKAFSLTDMPKSVLGFGVAMSTDAEEIKQLSPVQAELADERLQLSWDDLSFSISSRAAPKQDQHTRVSF